QDGRLYAVDSSAWIGYVMHEACGLGWKDEVEMVMALIVSAGTVAEALIVAERRGVGSEVAELISGLGFEVVAVTAASARRIAAAYGQWGKGVHPASLNYGDCFAYVVDVEHVFPLPCVGDYFALDYV